MVRSGVAKALIILILSVIGLAVLGAIIYSDTHDQQPLGLPSGIPAPSFTLPALNGTRVSLADYKGKVVALSFWASFCDPCRRQMQSLQQDEDTIHKSGVVLLTVDVGEPEVTVNGFSQSYGLQMPVLLDHDHKVSDLYKVDQIPVTYFIDPSGTIRSMYAGPIDASVIEQKAEALKPAS